MYPAYDSYWDIRKGKSVRIASPVGQAQFMLSQYSNLAKNSPNEWMLLRRFADTIGIEHGTKELRELRRFAEHLKSRSFELSHGHVNPTIAIEAEKEIVLRSAPYYSSGMGHDISYAARILWDYENKASVFTQAERNLILTHAYFVGNASGTEQIASNIAAHNFSDRDIAVTCARIEEVNLEWSGVENLEGLEIDTAEHPLFRVDLRNCEDPMKSYPRFSFYHVILPQDTELLQNGVVIQPCADDPERWQSALWKIDQTYMAPRYYIKTDGGRFETAEYVDVDRPQDLEKSVSAGCLVPPQVDDLSIVPKKSIRAQLRKTAQEISQQSASKEHSKGGESR